MLLENIKQFIPVGITETDEGPLRNPTAGVAKLMVDLYLCAGHELYFNSSVSRGGGEGRSPTDPEHPSTSAARGEILIHQYFPRPANRAVDDWRISGF